MAYLAAFMRAHPAARGRIIAPTFADAVESYVEGPSGLLALDSDVRWQPSAPGGANVAWPNGSEVLLLGTPTPRDVDRLRASGNRHIRHSGQSPHLLDAHVWACSALSGSSATIGHEHELRAVPFY